MAASAGATCKGPPQPPPIRGSVIVGVPSGAGQKEEEKAPRAKEGQATAHAAAPQAEGQAAAHEAFEVVELEKQVEATQQAVVELQRTVSGLENIYFGALVALSLQAETAMATAADAADAAQEKIDASLADS